MVKMEFLRTANIIKRYASVTALDDINITIPKGSIYGLLGPNGAGKTSLIRIINLITSPDSGTVYIENEKISQKHLPKIGYLPEERGLYKKMKTGEQAVYLAMLKGMAKHEAIGKLKTWFEKFDLLPWWDKKIEELSKGMQQKVQFIVTVIHEPSLLIFDEPFSGFDPINTNLLKKEILRLKEQGSTIIFSTHNMSSVEEICDNIALINKSQKILEGPISEIKSKFRPDIFSVAFNERVDKMGMTLSADYKILKTEEHAGLYKVKFRLLKEMDTNSFISFLMKFGNIVSFQEELPDMNEIFIRVVNDANAIPGLN